MRLWQMSATQVAALVNAREVSAAEVLEATLERVEAVDGEVAAYCTLDARGARAGAAAVQQRVDAGEALPLAGVPLAVKDLLDTAGLRSTYGSWAYAEHVPEHDDVAVARLRTAGAVVVGKTNTSEFGYVPLGRNRLFPTTRNPWDLARAPGGSSAGSAAALASGTAALALGSDGGGSVRVPAALCGLVGIKPSMGRVPCWPSTKDDRLPGASSWESLEHVGPMARTVGDAALALEVMSGPDPHDRYSLPGSLALPAESALERLRGLRVGFSPDLGYGVVDPAVEASARAGAEALAAALGTSLIPVPDLLDDPYDVFAALIARDSDLVGLRRLAETLGDRMSPYVRAVLERRWTAEELTTAHGGRQRAVRQMVAVMDQVDLLLTPTSCVAGFDADGDAPTAVAGRPARPSSWISLCWPANLTGQPAASVPSEPVAGMPCGLQVVAGHLRDDRVVDACRALEVVAPWAQRHPAGWDLSG